MTCSWRTAVTYCALLLVCFALGARGQTPPLRVRFESPLRKVFLDAAPPQGKPSWTLSMARGERESAQFLISARRALRRVTVAEPAFRPVGLEVELSLVGHVRTSPEDPRPWAKGEPGGRVGWWPDPLLPNRSFDVAAGETQAVWITVYAPENAAPGIYEAEVTVNAPGVRRSLPLHVRVFDITLPRRQELRNAAFMPPGNLSAHYRPAGGIGGEPFWELYQAWVKKAFSYHLGPTFDMMMGWNQGASRPPRTAGPLTPTAEMRMGRDDTHLVWPVLGGRGHYDFRRVDDLAAIGREYGMRQFAIAMFAKNETWQAHSQKLKDDMTDFLHAYASHLREADLLDAAYVYNVDEPPASHWDTVSSNHRFVKSVEPGLKTWLCLNQPKAMLGLVDSTDILDVYIRQYDEAAADLYRKSGKQIIWAVCVWPHEHPNLFIEYPALDARIIGWLTYRYRISGFEYWGLNQWGPSTGNLEWADFEGGGTRTRWQRSQFPWGDGWLMYPGPGGTPLSSVRFENLRDGFEDAELLLALDESGRKQEAAGLAATVAASVSDYASDPEQIEAAHVRLLEMLSSPSSRAPR